MRGQVSSPGWVLRGHYEWPAESSGFPLSPVPGVFLEKMLAQHDDHAVKKGEWVQDLSDIVQQGSRQQFRVGLTGGFEPFKDLKGMRLLGKLHPAEQGDLRWAEMGQERSGLNPLSRAKQGIPELAGAVGKPREQTHLEPSITCPFFLLPPSFLCDPLCPLCFAVFLGGLQILL
jgi:hypothetical protein